MTALQFLQSHGGDWPATQVSRHIGLALAETYEQLVAAEARGHARIAALSQGRKRRCTWAATKPSAGRDEASRVAA